MRAAGTVRYSEANRPILVRLSRTNKTAPGTERRGPFQKKKLRYSTTSRYVAVLLPAVTRTA